MSQLQIELDAAFAERKKASRHWTHVIKSLKAELWRWLRKWPARRDAMSPGSTAAIYAEVFGRHWWERAGQGPRDELVDLIRMLLYVRLGVALGTHSPSTHPAEDFEARHA